ncbi:hypothetical protein DFH11DRAFT_1766604 [Phellopilus nigrolimitatus]|nr:hypothetical protein DFH11DRAFT_1766604 [Phellopilus nigrolimitatus]
MSSSSPPTMTTTGAPSSTSSASNDVDSNSGNGTLATSSSLYLFTFLATLLLLLAVSCAIVIRSLVIRRRFQRRVQEALAQGIILPPQPGQRRRGFGKKPKLWDAWIAPDDGDVQWKSLMPVSVRIISDTLTGSGERRVHTPVRSNFLQTASLGLAQASERWRPSFPFFWRTHAPPPASSDAATYGSEPREAVPEQPVMEHAKLQVNVMIAMPSPYRPRAWAERDVAGVGAGEDEYGDGGKGKAKSFDGSHEDGEDEVPDVVFGVAEVPWTVLVERPADQPPPDGEV